MILSFVQCVGALALLLVPSGALTQDLDPSAPMHRTEREIATRRVVLEGSVRLPGGAPAEGAVVVSSAGGQAVTDSTGRYAFEVQLPLDASETQVTGVSLLEGTSLVASARVDLLLAGERVDTGSLELGGGGGCEPSWLPTFGGNPGVDGQVYAVTVFDDGAGPALFAGGGFTSAGGTGANRIAKWDGSAWSALGSGLTNSCWALTAFDDGTGSALYVGGSFTVSPAGDSFLARWQGCLLAVGQAFCFGDGSGTACPCANQGGPDEGCRNSTGEGALLAGQGSASAGADDLVLFGSQIRPNQPALLFAGTHVVNGGNGAHFGDGLRCAGGSVLSLGVRFASGLGEASWGPNLGGIGGWSAGEIRRFQAVYRDPQGSPCGSGFNLTHGFEVLFTP